MAEYRETKSICFRIPETLEDFQKMQELLRLLHSYKEKLDAKKCPASYDAYRNFAALLIGMLQNKPRVQ